MISPIVTIASLGVTMQLPEADRHSYSKDYLNNNLMVLLAGRVAEELVFNAITTGAGNDIERATNMARRMVCEWGMSDVIGPMAVGEQGEEVFIGREWAHSRNFSEDTARVVDAEVKKFVENARDRCHALLTEHMDLLHALAAALLERETITGEDIDLLIKGEPLPPFNPATPSDGANRTAQSSSQAAPHAPAEASPVSAAAAGSEEETFTLEADDKEADKREADARKAAPGPDATAATSPAQGQGEENSRP